jgi:hypothetical protein
VTWALFLSGLQCLLASPRCLEMNPLLHVLPRILSPFFTLFHYI